MARLGDLARMRSQASIQSNQSGKAQVVFVFVFFFGIVNPLLPEGNSKNRCGPSHFLLISLILLNVRVFCFLRDPLEPVLISNVFFW